MTARLRLTGIETEGRHGASSGEREQPQRFVVDLEVDVGPLRDELAATADYRTIVSTVRDAVSKDSVVLLETLAERVAEAVVGVPGVEACRATVFKPEAAERLGIVDVSAQAERTR